ncbi:hypothetical protein C0J52_14155 [Blattella germanica]|nr:hypothetical protein C0J52_14155 [Blattella germanica]
MILNAYTAIRKDFPSYTIDQCVTKTAKMLFVSKATVYRIKADQGLGPNSSTSLLSTPGKKKTSIVTRENVGTGPFRSRSDKENKTYRFFLRKTNLLQCKRYVFNGHLYYNCNNIYIFI